MARIATCRTPPLGNVGLFARDPPALALHSRCGMNAERNCVYILKSERHPDRFYTGLTSDISARLASHNAGLSPHTASGRPWRLIVSVNFEDGAKAKEFEEYLKSGSGRAFAVRHFR